MSPMRRLVASASFDYMKRIAGRTEKKRTQRTGRVTERIKAGQPLLLRMTTGGEKRIICLPCVAFLVEEMKNGEEIVITAEAKNENGGHLAGADRTLKPAGLSPTREPGFNTHEEIIALMLTLNLL
ncbi:uncharacterized [Tachysurus ichikawai]